MVILLSSVYAMFSMLVKIGLPERETTVNLKSASFVVLKPRLLFGESFA